MKKIDLHIHTVPTISDTHFTFSLEVFKRYVEDANLDAVAVTNHDVFDAIQFKEIRDALNVTVFPGIEINVDNGHVLVISDGENLDDFDAKTDLVTLKVTQVTDCISVEELEEIFEDLNNYLVIPHYDKKPRVTGDSLERIKSFAAAGEVDCAKKFVRNIKDNKKLTPVLFSDVRIRIDLKKLPTRQTFIDCGDLTLNAIKSCLQDKTKITLSESDGNELWQIFDDGQKLSTGLNVLLGERSSGKTYTLDEIDRTHEHIKYIRQFALVQQNEAAYEKEFNDVVQRKRSSFIDKYLSGFKSVLDEVMNVDLRANQRSLDKYIETLLKSAEEAGRRDAYSKTALFNEVEFPQVQGDTLNDLISSVRQIIENIQYKQIIEKHVEIEPLKRLACELIELLWSKSLENKKKKLVNELVNDVKLRLKMRTSAVQLEDVDLYSVCMDNERVKRFTLIVDFLKKEAVISKENIQGYCIEAKKMPYAGAGEIKTASGVITAFSDAYAVYGTPYKYLLALLSNESLTRSELYKLFVKINYRILNKDGFEVSGGERSEFRLLQEIADAQNYDVLLIDEPESSFDNPFLKSDVNQIIKEISTSMPVVVVTHNSTVGASVEADYLLYAKKNIEGGNVSYKLYSGHPTDKQLTAIDGDVLPTHKILMNSLEAGIEAYGNRREAYEAIED